MGLKRHLIVFLYGDRDGFPVNATSQVQGFFLHRLKPSCSANQRFSYGHAAELTFVTRGGTHADNAKLQRAVNETVNAVFIQRDAAVNAANVAGL